jgi:hypothetical protein
MAIVVKIANADDRKVYLRLSVFLPPGEEEQGEENPSEPRDVSR